MSLWGCESLLDGDLKEEKKSDEFIFTDFRGKKKSVKMDSNFIFVLSCMILGISLNLSGPQFSHLLDE